MGNPSEGLGKEEHLQTVSRRTFLEVTAGLFAAYSGTTLAGDSQEGGAAARKRQAEGI